MKADNRDTRLDASYFSPAALAADVLIAKRNPQPISAVAADVRSFGAYALTNEVEYQEQGVPFLRGTDFSGDFIDFKDVLRISSEAHELLHKSEVLPGTVLLSMSGSVGSVAVALDDWEYPLNSNQDIAKIIPDDIDPFYLAAYLSCSLGRTQVQRLPVGSVQQHIFLWMIERLQVPRLGPALESAIAGRIKQAYRSYYAAAEFYAQAETTLLTALGLETWAPPEPVSYQEKASALRAAKRIDAEFFDPRHLYAEQVVARASFTTLGRLAEFVSSGPAWPSRIFAEFDDPSGVPFVRIRNCKPGEIDATRLDRLKAEEVREFDQDMATSGDLLIGMDGIKWFYAGLLKGSAYVNQRVAWVRLANSAPSPEFIQLVINSPVGQAQLLRRMTIAQTVGHITLSDVRDIKLPRFSSEIESEISQLLRAASGAKDAALTILESGKRAIEVAIEHGENAATAFLNQREGAN